MFVFCVSGCVYVCVYLCVCFCIVYMYYICVYVCLFFVCVMAHNMIIKLKKKSKVFLMIVGVLSNPYGLLWWPDHRYVLLAIKKDLSNSVYILIIACLIAQTSIFAFYGSFSTKTTRCLTELVESVKQLGNIDRFNFNSIYQIKQWWIFRHFIINHYIPRYTYIAQTKQIINTCTQKCIIIFFCYFVFFFFFQFFFFAK